jgi:urease beta subunit
VLAEVRKADRLKLRNTSHLMRDGQIGWILHFHLINIELGYERIARYDLALNLPGSSK